MRRHIVRSLQRWLIDDLPLPASFNGVRGVKHALFTDDILAFVQLETLKL